MTETTEQAAERIADRIACQYREGPDGLVEVATEVLLAELPALAGRVVEVTAEDVRQALGPLHVGYDLYENGHQRERFVESINASLRARAGAAPVAPSAEAERGTGRQWCPRCLFLGHQDEHAVHRCEDHGGPLAAPSEIPEPTTVVERRACETCAFWRIRLIPASDGCGDLSARACENLSPYSLGRVTAHTETCRAWVDA